MAILGTGFRRLSDIEIDIFTKSDFPNPPVGGKIVLDTGTYWVKSLIDLGTDTFVIAEGASVGIQGLNAFQTGFVTLSTGALFSSENKAIFSLGFLELFITTPLGSVFDISSPSFNLSGGLFMFEDAFGGCKSMGTIQNMGTVVMELSAIRSTDEGLTIDSCGLSTFELNQFLDWNDAGATMFSFVGDCRNIAFNDTTFTVKSTESIFFFDSAFTATNVTVGHCARDIDQGSGSVFAAGSLDQNADNFLFDGNNNIPDTQNLGNMFQRDNATVTTITTQGASGNNVGFVQVANFSAGELARFTFASNTLTSPNESGTYKLSYTACVQGSTNKTYECALEIDGSIDDSSLSCLTIPTGGNPDTISGNTTLTIGANKTIKLMIRNVSGTQDVTVIHASVSVIKLNS